MKEAIIHAGPNVNIIDSRAPMNCYREFGSSTHRGVGCVGFDTEGLVLLWRQSYDVFLDPMHNAEIECVSYLVILQEESAVTDLPYGLFPLSYVLVSACRELCYGSRLTRTEA